jgi:hypothetical protein
LESSMCVRRVIHVSSEDCIGAWCFFATADRMCAAPSISRLGAGGRSLLGFPLK